MNWRNNNYRKTCIIAFVAAQHQRNIYFRPIYNLVVLILNWSYIWWQNILSVSLCSFVFVILRLSGVWMCKSLLVDIPTSRYVCKIKVYVRPIYLTIDYCYIKVDLFFSSRSWTWCCLPHSRSSFVVYSYTVILIVR